MVEKEEPPESQEDDSQEKKKSEHVDFYQFPPERPLECSECKKPIAVHYTGIVGKNVIHTLMCADCPFLQQHLKGIPANKNASNSVDAETGLCCGNCGTTLENIRMGNAVGCSSCYDVFSDILVSELHATSKLPSQFKPSNKKSLILHLGRSPGETNEFNPSLKLLALNEALSETLKLEDYEQAAWIRDQIKALTENAQKNKNTKNANNKRNGQDSKEKGTDER